jgi:hypothetical protein
VAARRLDRAVVRSTSILHARLISGFDREPEPRSHSGAGFVTRSRLAVAAK